MTGEKMGELDGPGERERGRALLAHAQCSGAPVCRFTYVKTELSACATRNRA